MAHLSKDHSQIVDFAERIAEKKLKDVDTHQVRNFFSLVSEIKLMTKKTSSESEVRQKIIMLKPMLAYAAGRKKELKAFYKEMKPELDYLKNDSEDFDADLRKFFDMCSSIVAFHKFYNKKNK